MKPTVGRIVHYVSFGTPGGEFPSVCRAAMVTAEEHGDIGSPVISIAVVNPTGLFFHVDTPYADPSEMKGGTWHWPERAEA